MNQPRIKETEYYLGQQALNLIYTGNYDEVIYKKRLSPENKTFTLLRTEADSVRGFWAPFFVSKVSAIFSSGKERREINCFIQPNNMVVFQYPVLFLNSNDMLTINIEYFNEEIDGCDIILHCSLFSTKYRNDQINKIQPC